MRKLLKIRNTIYTKSIVYGIVISILCIPAVVDSSFFIPPETVYETKEDDTNSAREIALLLLYDQEDNPTLTEAFQQQLAELERLLIPFTEAIAIHEREDVVNQSANQTANETLSQYDAIVYWGAASIELPTYFLDTISMSENVIWIGHNIEQLISYQESKSVHNTTSKNYGSNGYKHVHGLAELLFKQTSFPIEPDTSMFIRVVPEGATITSEVSDFYQTYPFSWATDWIAYITEVSSEIATHVVFVDTIWSRLQPDLASRNTGNDNDRQAELAFYLDGIDLTMNADRLRGYFETLHEQGSSFAVRLSWDRLQKIPLDNEYIDNTDIFVLLQDIAYYNGSLLYDDGDFNPWRTATDGSFRYKVMIPYQEQALAMIQHTNYWQHLPYAIVIVPISSDMELLEVVQLLLFLEKQDFEIFNLQLVEAYLDSHGKLLELIGAILDSQTFSFYHWLFQQASTVLAIVVFIVMISFFFIVIFMFRRKARLYENISG